MSISIAFTNDKTAYFPTETLAGHIAWNLKEPEGKIEIKLFWYTRGKGSEDVVMVDALMLENPAPAGEHDFSFDLPLSPYSFSGRLISLIWAVEVVTENECERSEFVLSHMGKEILLT